MASANDMKTANRTYEKFVAGIKYTLPPILLLVAFIIWLIA